MVPAPGSAIGPLARDELPAAVRVLARAFRDNPLNIAVIDADAHRRERANAAGMRALLPVAREHGQAWAARRDGAVVGVLVATPPFCHPLPAPPLGTRLRTLAGQGFRAGRRWSRVFDVLVEAHPPEPHWYLGTLGVDPDHWHRGTGGDLVARWLAQPDREGVPAYLETDLERNVGFYARRGFELVGEESILGVRIWRMLRRR